MNWDLGVLLCFILAFGVVTSVPSIDHDFTIDENGLRHYILEPENHDQSNQYDKVTTNLFLRYDNPWLDHLIEPAVFTIIFVVEIFILLSVLYGYARFWSRSDSVLSPLLFNLKEFFSHNQLYTKDQKLITKPNDYFISEYCLNSNPEAGYLLKNKLLHSSFSKSRCII